MSLHHQRQLNVQQQNERTERSIRQTALYWRKNGVPEALRACGDERGVEWQKSIVIELAIDFPGMPSLFGLLLTQDERFVSFEIDTDELRLVARQVEQWEDVSSTQNVATNNRGIGAGHGALAIKVRRELSH